MFILNPVYRTSCCLHADQILQKMTASHKMLSKAALLYYMTDAQLYLRPYREPLRFSLTHTHLHCRLMYASCMPCEFGWKFSYEGFDKH
jgi:hypothetical protein